MADDREDTPRVLLVEDDPIQRRSFVRWIPTVIGATIVAVGDPDDALDLLTAGPFHVVLSDDDLGARLRGRELLEIVRLRWPQVRRLLMSGGTQPDGPVPAWDAFLPKPVDRARLVGLLRGEEHRTTR